MVCPGPKQHRSSRVEPGPRRCLTAVTREHHTLLPSVLGKRKGKFISSGLLSGLHPRLSSEQWSVCASVGAHAEFSSGRVGAVHTETGQSRTVPEAGSEWQVHGPAGPGRVPSSVAPYSGRTQETVKISRLRQSLLLFISKCLVNIDLPPQRVSQKASVWPWLHSCPVRWKMGCLLSARPRACLCVEDGSEGMCFPLSTGQLSTAPGVVSPGWAWAQGHDTDSSEGPSCGLGWGRPRRTFSPPSRYLTTQVTYQHDLLPLKEFRLLLYKVEKTNEWNNSYITKADETNEQPVCFFELLVKLIRSPKHSMLYIFTAVYGDLRRPFPDPVTLVDKVGWQSTLLVLKSGFVEVSKIPK